jgi:hypothetical protein
MLPSFLRDMRSDRLALLDGIRLRVAPVARIPLTRFVIVNDSGIALAILRDTDHFPLKGLGLRDARLYLGSGRLTATMAEWSLSHPSTQALYNGSSFRQSAEAVLPLLQASLPETGAASVGLRLQPLLDAAIMRSLLTPMLGPELSSLEDVGRLIADINCLTSWTSRRLSLPFATFSRLSWRVSRSERAAYARLQSRIMTWQATAPAGTLRSFATTDCANVGFELLTLLLAGFETTSATVGFAIDAVARSPTGGETIASAEDPLQAARAVVLETLRLHPPVWAITRLAVADAAVGGWCFSKGTEVLIDVRGVQRDPAVWARPNGFDPSRFDDASALPASYLPFGAGPRQCVGRRLGIDESASIVAWLFSNYRVSAQTEASPPVVGLAQRPGGSPVYKLARR